MQKPLGIIGGGNMGEALIAGMTQSRILTPAEIFFFEPRGERKEYIQKKYGVSPLKDNQELVSRARTVILAVKPRTAPEVLTDIGPLLKPDHLFISICAGVPLDYLQSFCPLPVRMVRAMPNTPALIQKGATALALSQNAGTDDLTAAESIFQAVGVTAVVQESQMDAVTGLSGSGPAYIFAVIEALTAGAVKEGLPQDIALNLASQTVLGAAELVRVSEKHPASLRDQVCTPGGTTIAGIYELEKGGVRLALMNAVIAATRRSKELGESLAQQTAPGPAGHSPKRKRA